MKLSQYLKKKCEEQGIFNYQELKKRLNGRVSVTYLWKIEKEDEIPSPEILRLFSHALHIPYDELVDMAVEQLVQNFIEKTKKRYRTFE